MMKKTPQIRIVLLAITGKNEIKFRISRKTRVLDLKRVWTVVVVVEERSVSRQNRSMK